MTRLDRWLTYAGKPYMDFVTRREAARQQFKRVNERPVEYRFVFEWLNRLQPRTVLDVGTGTTALPALMRSCGFLVDAMDNVRDYWPSGMTNRHWRVRHDDITAPQTTVRYDVVTCVSVLEHIADQIAAVRGLRALTNPAGHVLLTTPFGAVGHSNVFTLPQSAGSRNPYICRQHTQADLEEWLHVGFALKHIEYWRGFTSPYCSVGELVRPLQQVGHPEHFACIVLCVP